MQTTAENLSSGPPRRTRSTTAEGMGSTQRTACLNCRTLRQRCNRKTPCDRCVASDRMCQFPSKSNRGRKQGSTNKPETAEKLLARIRDSSVQDEVVAALLQSSSYRQTQAPAPQLHAEQPPAYAATTTQPASYYPPAAQNQNLVCLEEGNGESLCGDLARERNGQASLISPLHILAATVSRKSSSRNPPRHPFILLPNLSGEGKTASRSVDEKVAKYFSTQPTYKRDWDVLAAQPIDSTFKLEPGACDPVTARLITREDAAYYFTQFFTTRNPLIGLLEDTFHTPTYVFEMSFTLFSAICALGCAVSTRPRDRLLYPALYSIAESDMKWSIATSIKSVEIIQAIVIMQYWAPVSERQLEDPYWLHLNHATQLAREIGLGRPACVSVHVNNLSTGRDEQFKMRLLRNFERTWLYIFIADKSFGIITGRSLRVNWNDMPTDAGNWWQKPQTKPSDRLISGLVAMRKALLEAKDASGRLDKSAASIAMWHEHAFERLSSLREESTTLDLPIYAVPLKLLSWYHDHSILILNAQARRDLLAIGTPGEAPEVAEVSRKTIQIGCRLLEGILSDPVLKDLKYGFHNNMFIMICHAATETLQALQREGQAISDFDKVVAKLEAIPQHLEVLARGLPASSHAPLYLNLSRFFVSQMLETIREPVFDSAATDNIQSQDIAPAEWYLPENGSLVDPATWLDMGLLTTSQQEDTRYPEFGMLPTGFNLPDYS